MALTPDTDQFSQFLRLAFLRSPNYTAGVSGWTINQDGSAEFNNLTLRGTFLGSNWILDSTGIYFYSGVPALGNPPIAYSAKPGITADPKGNTLPATGGGFVAVDANGFTVVDHSGLNFGQISPAPAAGAVGGAVFAPNRLDGNLEIESGIAAAADTFAEILLQSATTAGGTQQVISDRIVAWQPGSVHISAEIWHTIAPVAGFSAGSPSPRYQLEPIGGGRVRLSGVVNLTANQVAGTTLFTLPAGYVPAQNHFFAAYNTLSGYAAGGKSVQVNSVGQIQVGSAGSNGNFMQLDGIVFELD